ncbi:metallo-beta-lactamase superfamily protein [Aquimarina sp. MAR_2010_214]|uniref:MBL fold metallo-hydrolase n=1 Tax=Aquimarina sp. MAR_2010_214 TaxID=1250026 RepID=UPI000CBF3F61|nr:MBL fold metallo-hydrolase [Aquimarina sp. MAR_2010_214]PKV49698.1 metallo-beta-lactamase superfamily protein [Aquimarina sp. MAR_2010_214]
MRTSKLIRVNILALLILTSLSSCGQKITSDNIIDMLNEKYKFTTGLKKYTVTYKFTGLNPYQSHDYKHPEAKINRFGIYTIDVDKEKKEYFTHDKSQFPGNFIFEFKHFQNSKKAVSYDVNGVIRGKVLKKLDKNAYEKQRKRAGDVLSFEQVHILLTNHKMGKPLKIEVGKTFVILTQTVNKDITNTYTFESSTLKLKKLKSTEDDSFVEYRDFVSKDGVEYAEKQDIYRSNKFSASVSIENFKTTMGIPSSKFMVPNGYKIPEKTAKSEPKITKIANDIYIINVANNSRFILLKIIKNDIMVFGAPRNDEITEKVVHLISEKFPMKTIQSVFVSHPHNDHIGGLPAYAERGITILADDYTIDAIQNFPAFNKTIETFKFETLTNKKNINGVRFYVLKNNHSLKQSFVYFEKEQLIYEGDFLEIPADNSIATHLSDVEKQFIEFVRDEKLKIKRIVQHHRNPNVSVATMNAYYEANTK